MSEEDPDLSAIAESIERGDDPYQVPEEMLVEPEPGKIIDKSLYGAILKMTVGERLKLALRGNRDARMILVRDPNRLIQRFVLHNPRITDDEIIMVARNRNVDVELLRMIGEHKHWSRNPLVRLGMVTNPKSPVGIALQFVSSLSARDLRFLAKSKNVSSAVVSAARRLLLLREK
jgi:hypothetical protein